ncbi:hypothetical protein DCAR_0209332 [Daucus carota subsp. sativus]|uniref:Pentatricopeptide repeat-containing protein n=1 Tax=Daucus carota subsp. sativus TaxID=79200 RepID=A0AAF1ARV9_DAUCS|nr:PREDICTED: putative pentatricopeptide repeat-containing protein At3g25970 [Daucus carota subsp. sativus]WOG90091.1 hypothetical protein DCAR_0209332 [Daucus carota subsp. sativus]
MRPLHFIFETSLAKIVINHCQAIKLGTICDIYTNNILISGYTRCKELSLALKVFDEMLQRDTASWNSVIAGYINSGSYESAWEFLKSMKRNGVVLDGYSFGSILKGIACDTRLFLGQQVHSDIVKMDCQGNVYAESALLDMYAKCGRVEDAMRVFECMPERNSVSWNALIAGYVEVGDVFNSFRLMSCMKREHMSPDDGTFAPLLTLLEDPVFYKLMLQLHGTILKHGLAHCNTVYNATITAYSECGSIQDAKRMFDSCPFARDLVTWNAMLAAYIVHEQETNAFKLFLNLRELGLTPDLYTYTSIISACSGKPQEFQGKSLHGLVIKVGLEQSTPISNSLMAMYIRLNSLYMEEAFFIFSSMKFKDRVSWNSILTGFSQYGLSENALKLFQDMRLNYQEIDHYAFSAVLRSCADMAALQLGQQVHVLSLKSGLETNEYVTSSLIFMYSKCGYIEDARRCFESTCKDSSVSWNSIMFGYAQHGQGQVALDLFHLMKNENIKMDHITFVAVLTACSHIGLVDEGKEFLQCMESDYGIPPRMEHYACAVDLFGRAGRLQEAKALVEAMPFQPDAMVWKTLLGACRMCGDIKLASEVASYLLESDPGEHCTYVLLSDIYGHLRRWDEIATVKRLMRERGVKKIPGWSWIELKNEIHSFNAEDHSHPCCQEIYTLLFGLLDEISILENGNNIELLTYLG